ncbi:MAG: hypothetical protein HZA89_05190 [Verrucomicrobia bacterium]|nr:hypothetical protein [Verrucomicrobiota bacterium]
MNHRSMRNLFASLLAAALVAAPGCKKQDAETPARPASPPKADAAAAETWLRLHFVGWQPLAASNAAPKLQQVFALPDSKALRDETLDKLASSLPGLLFLPTNAVTTNHAALLRPLLEDLGRTEMFFELRGQGGRVASWSLALQLDDTRAKLWQTNLRQTLAPVWQLAATAGKNPGWGGRRAGVEGTMNFAQVGAWAVLGFAAQSSAWTELVEKISTTGRPIEAAKDYWLKADVNLPRLAPFTPFAGWFANLPQAQLTVSGKDEYLRTVVRLLHPQPLKLEYQPWNVPTNTIREPLNSFTAWRGIADWLASREGIKKLRLDPVPNELFLWAQEETPYQSFAAWPANNASNQIPKFTARLAELFNQDLAAFKLGKIVYQTNNQAVWQGLPIIVPAVQVAPEPGDRGWALGLFPSIVTTNPFPAELLAQLNRPNLIYYDWEVTEFRLLQWRLLAQLNRMTVFAPENFVSETTGMRWQRLAAPLLGNTVTEALLTAPAEMQIIRKSHLGLTGFELTLLEKWLSAPEFPRFHFNFSPPANTAAPPAPPKP